jgi:acetylornithine/succinyldiaminopimelate/putrescine aminotransferase
VQTGVGRTGTFFALEQFGVQPHLVTLAKGLANGLPIGALLVGDLAPTGLAPGDHASTFGGNPVVCAAACAVVEAVDEDLLANVRARSAEVAEALPVRGAGLLLGVETESPAAEIVADCFEAGLLVTSAGPTTLRLTPPLTVSPTRSRRRSRSSRRSSLTAHRRERQGAILRLIRDRQISTRPSWPLPCTRPVSRPSRRPSRATSPSSVS